MNRHEELKAQNNLIKIPADKGSATVFENESNNITKEQDQINAMDVHMYNDATNRRKQLFDMSEQD